jgi:hypothetical protein
MIKIYLLLDTSNDDENNHTLLGENNVKSKNKLD